MRHKPRMGENECNGGLLHSCQHPANIPISQIYFFNRKLCLRVAQQIHLILLRLPGIVLSYDDYLIQPFASGIPPI